MIIVMTVIKLNGTETYRKFEAIRKAGFDLISDNKGYRLIDRSSTDIEQYIDVNFKTMNEALSVLAGYLLNVGYIVVAA